MALMSSRLYRLFRKYSGARNSHGIQGKAATKSEILLLLQIRVLLMTRHAFTRGRLERTVPKLIHFKLGRRVNRHP